MNVSIADLMMTLLELGCLLDTVKFYENVNRHLHKSKVLSSQLVDVGFSRDGCLDYLGYFISLPLHTQEISFTPNTFHRISLSCYYLSLHISGWWGWIALWNLPFV